MERPRPRAKTPTALTVFLFLLLTGSLLTHYKVDRRLLSLSDPTTTFQFDYDAPDCGSKSLPTNLLNKIQAYLNISVEERPFPPNTPGAFLHVGKAGGSTLCSTHPLAYHSFMAKSHIGNNSTLQKRIQNDNYFGATTTYIHTPDFHLLRKKHEYQGYSFYVANLRDPFTRFVSTFTYLHPQNGMVGVRSVPTILQCLKSFTCFPTIESFAELLGDDPLQFEYPYPPGEAFDRRNTSCADLARAIMANKVKACFDHLYWNTKTILESIQGWNHDVFWPITTGAMCESTSQLSNRTLSPYELLLFNVSSPNELFLFVIRTEHMDQDFFKVNQLLGDPHPVLLKEIGINERVQTVNMVSKNITNEGRKRLCNALLPEYKVYFKALSRAFNLSPRDRQKSLEYSRTMCPELDWLFHGINFLP